MRRHLSHTLLSVLSTTKHVTTRTHQSDQSGKRRPSTQQYYVRAAYVTKLRIRARNQGSTTKHVTTRTHHSEQCGKRRLSTYQAYVRVTYVTTSRIRTRSRGSMTKHVRTRTHHSAQRGKRRPSTYQRYVRVTYVTTLRVRCLRCSVTKHVTTWTPPSPHNLWTGCSIVVLSSSQLDSRFRPSW
jgi:hypothetical protein